MPSEKFFIELALVALIFYGLKRVFDARSGERGLGVRVIQVAAAVTVFPVILILALEGVLEGEAVSTILGVVVGFTLSGVLKPVPARQKTGTPAPKP